MIARMSTGRRLLAAALAVAALGAAGGCVTPAPTATFTTIGHGDGAAWMGQFSDVAPTTATLDMTTIGVGVGVEVCLVLDVHSGRPQGFPPSSVHDDTTCQPAAIAGDQTFYFADILDSWDATTDGPLEGRWFTITPILRFPPGTAFPLTAARNLSIAGSTAVRACIPNPSQGGGSAAYPCDS